MLQITIRWKNGGIYVLKGIFAPIPTPFATDKGDIRWDEFKKNLVWWSQTSLAGLVVGG